MSDAMTEIHLDLMALPGDGLSRVLGASRGYLTESDRPCVAYLPAAALDPTFLLEETRLWFSEVAAVELLDPVSMDRGSILRVLDRSTLLYVPGGNTFVLAYRLQRAGLTVEIARRVRAGLPLVGFSAGAVLCGTDILNSNDANGCGCRDFAGLGLVPFSLNVHYPSGVGQPDRIERIAEYHAFHRTPVVALEDDARLHVEDRRITVVEGAAWLFDSSGGRTPYPGTL
jgi:dipeptidase E